MRGFFRRLFGPSDTQDRELEVSVAVETVRDRKLPDIQTAKSEDKDFYDSDAIAFTLDNAFRVAPADFLISYEDAHGRATSRVITVDQVAEGVDGEEYFVKAFCHLRGSNRYFRSSRIRSAQYHPNGKDILDGNVLKEMLNQSPAWHADKLLSRDPGRSQIQCFAFAAKADGRTTKAEVEVIAAWLRGTLPVEAPDDILHALTKEHLSFEEPSLTKARRARNRLKKLQLMNETLVVCEQIVKQRKSGSVQADAALAELRK